MLAFAMPYIKKLLIKNQTHYKTALCREKHTQIPENATELKGAILITLVYRLL